MRILVTGAKGQLGTAMVATLGPLAEVVPLDRQALDIEDPTAVRARVMRERPEVIVNCAAYNDVDGAEDRATDAIRVNAIAVRSLAQAAAEAGATFVHYSTDFVFDGLSDRPYTETDEPSPQSTYASSKFIGELFAAHVPRHYILRVETLFGGTWRRGSVDRIAQAIRAGEPARVFTDRAVTPSYVPDIVDATWRLLTMKAEGGLYHCVNSGVTTWFELATEIGKVLQIEPNLIPVRVAEVKLRAPRPQYAALSNDKLRAVGISMPGWRDALGRYLAA